MPQRDDVREFRARKVAPARPARDAHNVVVQLYVLAYLSPKFVEALPPFSQQRQEGLRPLERLRRVGCVGEVTELDLRVPALCGTLVIALLKAAFPRRTTSMFSCDIAYSERPTASRACRWSRKSRPRTILPSRTSKSHPHGVATSGPLAPALAL